MTVALAVAFDELLQLHEEVDRLVRPLQVLYAERLACKAACTDCCVDDITVFEVEAERIRRFCRDVLVSAPAPRGRCAMLDEAGLCRVYPHRPYVCRTQGLPLRWVEEDSVERRDVCPLSESTVELLELDRDSCWTLGPVEGRLATLQASVDGGSLKRLRLRDLFEPVSSR